MKCNDPCPLNQDCLYDFLVDGNITVEFYFLFLMGSTHWSFYRLIDENYIEHVQRIQKLFGSVYYENNISK
jgi:hypothetical protein